MAAVGDFPLHDAAADGNLVRLQVLLHLGRGRNQRKLDIDELDSNGQTALHVAVQYGHEQIVKLLIDLEASTSIQDERGVTPAALAERLGLPNIVSLFVNQVAAPDDADLWVSLSMPRQKRLHFPVHIAACRGKVEQVTKGLANRPTHLNEQDLAGCTPLLLAAACGHLEVVKLLAERGALPHFQAKDGSTAISAAQRHKQWEVVLYLKNGPRSRSPSPVPSRPGSADLTEPQDNGIPSQSGTPPLPSPSASPLHPSATPPERTPPRQSSPDRTFENRSPPDPSPSRSPPSGSPVHPLSRRPSSVPEDSSVGSSKEGTRSRDKMKPFMTSIREFSPLELSKATAGYSPTNLIGQGSFGKVFKGVLPDKTVIAVKAVDWRKLESSGADGARESAELQFRAEAEIVALVQHRHLVELLGYCLQEQHWLLVLEFMAMGSLSSHLHGPRAGSLGWTKRMRIAMGAAKGLCYLHEECNKRIIHRDIKAANILLTEDFEAKIADFGFAKVGPKEGSSFSTVNVAGTFGYMPKECLVFGEKQSWRSDVYSFGVVLLELITGRKPLDTTKSNLQRSLVVWAQSLGPRPSPQVYVDPRLKKYSPEEATAVFSVALQCVAEEPEKRPLMSKVVRMLVDAEDARSGPQAPQDRPAARFPPPPNTYTLQSMSSTQPQSIIQPLQFTGGPR